MPIESISGKEFLARIRRIAPDLSGEAGRYLAHIATNTIRIAPFPGHTELAGVGLVTPPGPPRLTEDGQRLITEALS